MFFPACFIYCLNTTRGLTTGSMATWKSTTFTLDVCISSTGHSPVNPLPRQLPQPRPSFWYSASTWYWLSLSSHRNHGVLTPPDRPCCLYRVQYGLRASLSVPRGFLWTVLNFTACKVNPLRIIKSRAKRSSPALNNVSSFIGLLG